MSDALRTAPDPVLPRGVVFDCDGTLADTESLSDRAWTTVLRARGYEPAPDDFAAVIGHPFAQNWDYYTARTELGDRDTFRAELREVYTDLFERELELHDDAVGVAHALVAAGVPIAVASSSSRRGVLAVLEAAGLVDAIRVVVGADDVARHKPDPLPYRTAAAGLGLPASVCTAVEDTPVGLRSARAAGMFTVAVVRAHGDPEALAAADRVVTTLELADLTAPGDR